MPSINSFGQLGYINTPSAFSLEESSIGLTINRNDPDRKMILIASPFRWLDANIFYVDITGKEYPGGYKQSYKDKGFSFKLKLPSFKGHSLAVGANDIAGTGYYNSEYIVISRNISQYEYTLGVGWGNYSQGYTVKNPFSYLDSNFKYRSASTKNRGGSFDLNNYFSGKHAALFGGFKYKVSEKQQLLLEYDPTSLNVNNYRQIEYPDAKTRVNFGYRYQFDSFAVKASIVRGSSFNLQFSFLENYKGFNHGKRLIKKNKNFYDLQKSLNYNNIGLVKISESEQAIKIKTTSNSFHNQQDLNKVIFDNSKSLAESKESLIILNSTLGMDVNEIIYKTYKTEFSKNEEYVDQNDLEKTFALKESYPIINNNIAPRIRNFIAARESFYHGGIFLEDNIEIIFSKNLFFLGNFKISLYDNFDNLYLPPIDTYPNQVRSDVKKYLNAIGDGPVIGRFEVNYFNSINKKHFFRLSSGIYEDMFGGYGLEYIYFPEGNLFSYGLEYFNLRKRDYAMNFSFKEYQNDISRVFINLRDPLSQININLSYGEYLAGDMGYTLELSRRMKNGIEMGVFFSRTDVPADLFGEGTFDKGIRLKIPFSIFNEPQNLASYEWRPLTKDPAALLIKSISLHDFIERFRIY